jgi:hypothetical protein
MRLSLHDSSAKIDEPRNISLYSLNGVHEILFFAHQYAPGKNLILPPIAAKGSIISGYPSLLLQSENRLSLILNE